MSLLKDHPDFLHFVHPIYPLFLPTLLSLSYHPYFPTHPFSIISIFSPSYFISHSLLILFFLLSLLRPSLLLFFSLSPTSPSYLLHVQEKVSHRFFSAISDGEALCGSRLCQTKSPNDTVILHEAIGASVEQWLSCLTANPIPGSRRAGHPCCSSSLSCWLINGYLGKHGEGNLRQSRTSHWPVSRGNEFLPTTGSKGQQIGDEHAATRSCSVCTQLYLNRFYTLSTEIAHQKLAQRLNYKYE